MTQEPAFYELSPSGDFDVGVLQDHLLRNSTIKSVPWLMKEAANLTTAWQTMKPRVCVNKKLKCVKRYKN